MIVNHQFVVMANKAGLYYRNKRILSKLKAKSDTQLYELVASLEKKMPDAGVKLRTYLLALNEINERRWQQKHREGINPYQP